MKPPAFQFYVDDFLGGTMHFTDAEIGLYIRLLCVQWSAGSLPDDDEELASYGKGPTPIARVKLKFKRCDDGRLRNERMEIVRKKQSDYIDACSSAGKVGAQRRWGAHNDPITTPIGSPIRNDGSPVSSLLSPSTKTGGMGEVTPLKRESNGSVSQAEEIYSLYPRKVGKPAAIRSIAKAIMKHGSETVKAATANFAKAWGPGDDLNFCPHPSTWFNQERYNDDPSTWAKTSTTPRTPFNLKAMIEAKEEAAAKLKFDGFSADRWTDKAAYEAYIKVIKEVRSLKDELSRLT